MQQRRSINNITCQSKVSGVSGTPVPPSPGALCGPLGLLGIVEINPLSSANVVPSSEDAEVRIVPFAN